MNSETGRLRDRRSRYLVYPEFQYRLLARLVSYWVLYHLGLWHLVFLVGFVCNKLDASTAGKGLWSSYGDFALAHTGVILCFLGMLPVFVCNMLKFSSRLAGPLVRFRNTIRAMADGKPVGPVRLRKHDLMSGFLAAFNRMVHTWNSQTSQAAAEELEESELVAS
jgi:hypothetical protein